MSYLQRAFESDTFKEINKRSAYGFKLIVTHHCASNRLHMKLENNWRYKSLESLEKDSWGSTPKDESYLVTTMHELRKKQLNDFTIEDLRIMIGQSIGLPFLIPLAIEQLEKDILAEGDFYEGDLLKSVLDSDPKYWNSEKDNWRTVLELFTKNEQVLFEFDTTRNIKTGWKDGFQKFGKMNSGV
jgi:hypothetical protein